MSTDSPQDTSDKLPAPVPADPPAAGVTFADFGLHADVQRAVDELGYKTPTPIQAQAIPVVMTGRDVMGAAQTGTGKTAGFALPILQRLMPLANTSASPARHPVRALILAPTRELADQIFENVRAYAKHTPLKVAVVFGGVDIKPQLAALRQGCEVLIATPGRLLDHVEQKTVNLSGTQVLVLDEADRMLDMGFLPDIQRIINLLPKQRQNLMFSATFSEEIKKLAGGILRDPQLIEVARRNATAENVEQTVYRVESTLAKRAAVGHLVRSRALEQAIVFTNTKIGASRLARELERDGLNAGAIHGDKSQQERLKTLDEFKAGSIAVLVATDVAARGLDIAELPAVINYDLPYSPEDYVHRIGRTGRAGASGVALSLMAPGDERYLSEIEKLIKRTLQPQPLAVQVERKRRDEDEPAARPAHERAAPRASGADAAERAPRRAPRERDEAPRRSARPPAGRGALPGHSSDPFFYQPYQPPQATADEPAPEESAAGGSGRTARKRPARPLPVLLGGKPSPSPN